MKKIFVSYTRKDEYVDTFLLSRIHNLISSDYSSYIDALHNDSINKQKRVESELVSSDIMLLIDSCSANNSNWVKREVELAQKHNIPVSSIKIDKHSTYKQIEKLISNTLKYRNKANNAFNADRFIRRAVSLCSV